MVEGARPIRSHSRIVNALIVGCGLQAEILCLGQGIGESYICFNVEYPGCDFVLPAVSPTVENESAVAAHIFKGDTGGVIGAPGQGIDQNLVGGVQSAANKKKREVLARQALAEEIAPASFHRRFEGIVMKEIGDPLVPRGPGA